MSPQSTTSWTLVEANNKYYARIKVLRVLCEAVEDALERISKKGKKNKKI
jgi:polyphosphate kinase 2 (PPK2 family)